MNQRNHKRTISILLAIFFVKSFAILFGTSVQFHMFAGGLAAVLSIAHICVNRKWLSSINKAHKAGKLNTKTKWQCRMSLLLVVSFSICILSGVVIGFPGVIYALAGVEDLFMFLVAHLFSAMISLLLVIVHVVQHVGHIQAYFRKKKRVQEPRELGKIHDISQPTD